MGEGLLFHQTIGIHKLPYPRRGRTVVQVNAVHRKWRETNPMRNNYQVYEKFCKRATEINSNINSNYYLAWTLKKKARRIMPVQYKKHNEYEMMNFIVLNTPWRYI